MTDPSGSESTSAPAQDAQTPSAPKAAPGGASPGTPGQAAEPAKAVDKEKNPAQKSREISNALAARKEAMAAKARAEAAEKTLVEERAQAAQLSAVLAKFKTDPLAALESVGLNYEELTKRAIAQKGANTPASRMEALEAQVKEMAAAKTKAEEAAKAAEVANRVAAYVSNVHEHAVKDAASYELLSMVDANDAKELIHDVLEEYGEKHHKLLSAKEACDMIEDYLLDEAVTRAKSKKVQAKLSPAAEPEKPAVKPKVDDLHVQKLLDQAKHRAEQVNKRQVRFRDDDPRTLTNKLGATPSAPSAPGKKLSPEAAMKFVLGQMKK